MQWLARVSVTRPIFAAVLILSLTVLGLFTLPQLPVERYPNVDIPFVTVMTVVPGAGPKEIESEVTEIIERNVGTVPGISTITSQSSEGVSLVTIEFVIEKNGDTAAQEVRSKVDLALADLPVTAERPVVEKFKTDDVPIVAFTLTSPGAPLRELTEYARLKLRPQLEGIRGVGQVSIVGGSEREIQVLLDPERLAAFDLAPSEVQSAIESQNLLVPGGAIVQGTTRFSLQTEGRVKTLEQLAAIVIRKSAGRAIRLSDVGRIVDGSKEAKSLARVNGEPAILLNVRKQSGENTVAVVDAIEQRLKRIEPTMPEGYETRIVRDEAVFVKASVRDVQTHLILGSILAAVVVLVFLRDWRSTIIAAIAIPASIIATFALMKVQGFTINVLTLLALTLAVGIVIDDAIIVLENIVRYLNERTTDRKEAAIKATNEIGLAVLATTLSLVAVFLPVAFISGITGRFLASFALTMTFSILVSLLVAFTITPMLGSLFLKPHAHPHGAGDVPGKRDWLTFVEDAYTAVLASAMRHRWVVVVLSAGALIAVVPLARHAKTGFLPSEDLSMFTVTARLPEGTALSETDRQLSLLAKELQPLPEVSATVVTVGDGGITNRGTILVKLHEIHERKHPLSSFDLMAKVRQEILPRYPKDWTITVASTDSFSESDASVQYVLTGPDQDRLLSAANAMVAELKRLPEVASVSTNAYPGKPQWQAQIDRERAAEYGVSVADIARNVRLLIEGEKVSRYSENGRQFDIRVLADADFRHNSDALRRFRVPAASATGPTTIPLSDVAGFVPSTELAEINRYGRQREIRVLVVPVPNASVGGLQEVAERVYAAQGLSSEYRMSAEGDAQETEKTFAAFGMAFLLSITFMYLILAAQFESWVHPVTILLSLPLCVPFALLPIVVMGDSLNLYSLLGILVLFGIVKKNSILQVDHANQLRASGMERNKAVIQASRDRLRPILMTTIAFVAGMIPLAMSHEAGAATNRSISIVVIGGQTLSLALTLIATPVFYSLFDDGIQWWAKRRRGTGTRGIRSVATGGLLLALMVWGASGAKAQSSAVAGTIRSVDEAVRIGLSRNAQPRLAAEQVQRAKEVTAQFRAALRPQPFVAFTYTRLSDPNAFGSTGLAATGNLAVPGGPSTSPIAPPGTTPVNLPDDAVRVTRSRQADADEQETLTPEGNANRIDLNVTTAQVGVNLPIDITGTLQRAVRIGRQDEELARLQEEQVRQELALTIRIACYQLLAAEESVRVQEAAVVRAVEQVRTVSERRKEGVVPAFDLLRAKTEELSIRQAEINARNQRDVALSALTNLLNVPAETPIRLESPELPSEPSLTLSDLLTQALAARPEARFARLSLDRSANAVRYARRGLEPQFNLSASGVYNANQAGFGFSARRATASVSAVVSLPLDDGGTTRAQVRTARSEQREADLRRDQFQRGIVAEVEQNLIAVRDAYARHAVAREAIREARAALDIAALRFSAGVGTQLETLDAQSALTRAEGNAASARFEVLSSLARLKRALGEG
ncbi:MAG: efflux RND transporter permease subunit [Capsulimonadales bacterium]|nr:efflux RND transporter permease subunit [Capsulimonadales bacterium]